MRKKQPAERAAGKKEHGQVKCAFAVSPPEADVPPRQGDRHQHKRKSSTDDRRQRDRGGAVPSVLHAPFWSRDPRRNHLKENWLASIRSGGNVNGSVVPRISSFPISLYVKGLFGKPFRR